MSKKCIKCGQMKGLSEFHKATAGKDGHRTLCAVCGRAASLKWKAENRERSRQTARQWHLDNPEKSKQSSRNTKLKKAYNIDLTQYERMLTEQKSVCAICFELETAVDYKTKLIKALAVDHCHATGKIRGLLCSRCNMVLGKAKDSTKLLESAAIYLRARG
jgi:Autographiviridae endonuclease VII